VTRQRVAGFGYLYVALALPALLIGHRHGDAGSALFSGATFAFLWFLASLRSRLVRYDPDGFFAGVVGVGGSACIALQAAALVLGRPQFAAIASACAATAIFGSSLAALRARKVPKWFGRAGIAGGVAVLGVGLAEGAAGWTLHDGTLFASTVGFMIWVVVTATYLLRR
jgi:hypothetical protein